jgi:hypothetical protein
VKTNCQKQVDPSSLLEKIVALSSEVNMEYASSIKKKKVRSEGEGEMSQKLKDLNRLILELKHAQA